MKAVKYDNNYYKTIGRTVLYMDHTNSRIRILKHHSLDNNQLKYIKQLADLNNLNKVISFTPSIYWDIFARENFTVEGKITRFFKGNDDALCHSFFLDKGRMISKYGDGGQMVGEYSQDYLPPKNINSPYEITDAAEADITFMTELFQSVFTTYPSPVFDKEYIRSNMKKNRVIYKAARHNGKIVGIASAELDSSNLNAELTDCVTIPEYRGQGILTAILKELEDQLKNSGYICLYSLCRSHIPSVNRAFKSLGYNYSGKMINNCHMCGNFEDMNIWVKLLE